MRKSTVNSSDLAFARVVSHRMAPTATGSDWAVQAMIDEQPRANGPSRSSAGSYQKSATTEIPQADFIPSEIDSWEVLLAWSLELCRARAAFIVDAQGFIIGSRGNPPSSGFEGIGAELCFAMEQLDRIDPESGPLQALELHFGRTNILGIKALDDNGGFFILGFMGPRAVHASVRDAVYRQAMHNLHRIS